MFIVVLLAAVVPMVLVPEWRCRDDDVLEVTLEWRSKLPADGHRDTAQREAHAIWRRLGVEVKWATGETADPATPRVTVVVTDEVAAAEGGGLSNLGWIRFWRDVPSNVLHVSASAALEAAHRARALGRTSDRLPVAAIRIVAARLIGRAMAHELGHYVLRSRKHTANGLMRLAFPAYEGLVPLLDRYRLDAQQMALLRARACR